MPTVTATDTDLYYERSGQGPPLLFLLGSSSTVDGSRILIDQFVPHFDLVVHDYRGLGRSGPVQAAYTMADCASDTRVVLDAVGWETARVAGMSFGGMVAQELAVTVPERVDRLALLCTSPGGAGGSSYALHELEGIDSDERAKVFPRLLDTRFDARWLDAHPGDRRLLELLADRPNAADASSEAQRGVHEQLQARRVHDVWDRLDVITCPTLVAAGRYDGIAPLPNSEAIVSRIVHSELRVYDGGHAFVAQDRTALPEIVGFLSERGA